MRQEAKSGAYGYHIIGILLGIIGLLIILIFVSLRSQADDTTTSATIENATPTISNVVVASSAQGSDLGTFSTSENTSTYIYVRGDITDNNGCSNVDGVTTDGALRVLLYRSSATCTGQVNWSELSCYAFSNSSDYSNTFTFIGHTYNDGNGVSSTFYGCSGGSDISMNFEMRIPISFNVDATDAGTYSAQNWVAAAMVSDSVSFTFSPTTTDDGFEIATLSALDIDDPTLDFGTVSIGSTSTQQTVAITNTGNNNVLDRQISGTNMPCMVGTIATDNIRFSSTSFGWAGVPRLQSAGLTFGVALAKSTVSTTASSDNSYWKLEVPNASSTAFSGSCSGTITFTAS